MSTVYFYTYRTFRKAAKNFLSWLPYRMVGSIVSPNAGAERARGAALLRAPARSTIALRLTLGDTFCYE